MSKQLNAQTSKRKNARSRAHEFGELVREHREAHGQAAPAATGRKPGKSADATYVKLTHYLRKETHQAVKIRLLQESQGRDFSELLEELLGAWLKTPQAA